MRELTFFIDGDLGGRFSRDWDAEQPIDDLLDEVERGVLTRRAALARAQSLPQSLDNLEQQNFIAVSLHELELRDEAGEIWARAFEYANSKIPAGFKGAIDWQVTDNRPFLRIAHGLLLTYMNQGDGKRALKLARQLLRWSPDDNLGVRFLVGDIELLCGHHDKALKHFLKHSEYPEALYSAALIYLRREQYVEAATCLRSGFLANGYIAEALCGRTLLRDRLLQRPGTSLASAEHAVSAIQEMVIQWSDQELDFLDYVFNHSAVMMERARYAELLEGLATLRSGPERSRVIELVNVATAAVDDTLSRRIIVEVSNSWGQTHWPWDREAALSPMQVES